MRKRKTFTHRRPSPDPEVVRLKRELHDLRGKWAAAVREAETHKQALVDYKATHTPPGYRLSAPERRKMMYVFANFARRHLSLVDVPDRCGACGGFGPERIFALIDGSEGVPGQVGAVADRA